MLAVWAVIILVLVYKRNKDWGDRIISVILQVIVMPSIFLALGMIYWIGVNVYVVLLNSKAY